MNMVTYNIYISAIYPKIIALAKTIAFGALVAEELETADDTYHDTRYKD